MKRFRRTKEEIALNLTSKQAQAKRHRDKKAIVPAYSSITYEELGDWVGRKSIVKVSKAWLDGLINQCASPPPTKVHVLEKQEQPKIEFKLTNLNE